MATRPAATSAAGANVSAWEIERLVNGCPGVADSAVVAVPSQLGEDDIKIIVRTAEPHALTASHVYDWCRERLAYYQVPRYIEMIRQLPTAPRNGYEKGNCRDRPRSSSTLKRDWKQPLRLRAMRPRTRNRPSLPIFRQTRDGLVEQWRCLPLTRTPHRR
ncbi:hypothetical protein [Nonomuraea sp. NPDC049141]|uniref:AMP-binding enzyme n=1 Tax=Nonomuraea sp. NPDC049141 TaxID=3155500 RepID=UPI0033EA0441